MTKITAPNHGLKLGDVIVMRLCETRLQRLLKFIQRPRVKVVNAVTETTFTLLERRMTWKEWCQTVWSATKERI